MVMTRDKGILIRLEGLYLKRSHYCDQLFIIPTQEKPRKSQNWLILGIIKLPI